MTVKCQRENKCFGVELVHVFGYVNQFAWTLLHLYIWKWNAENMLTCFQGNKQ